MDEIERCWCEKGAEPCMRNVTQEDMHCDVCRDGCGQVSVSVNSGPPKLLDPHAEVYVATESGAHTFRWPA